MPKRKTISSKFVQNIDGELDTNSNYYEISNSQQSQKSESSCTQSSSARNPNYPPYPSPLPSRPHSSRKKMIEVLDTDVTSALDRTKLSDNEATM